MTIPFFNLKPAAAAVFVLLMLLGAAPGLSAGPSIVRSAEPVDVEYVFDGDTIKAGGRVIRYIGIDTPEKGEPYYMEARVRNAELLKGKDVRVTVCMGEPEDKYGRTLGWVYADGVLVNGLLLADGLARTLIIPPCGLEKVGELRRLEREAKRARKGIWR